MVRTATSLADVHFTSWRARLVSTKQPARMSARATSHPLNQNGTTTWAHHEPPQTHMLSHNTSQTHMPRRKALQTHLLSCKTAQNHLMSHNTEGLKLILSPPLLRWLHISSMMVELTDNAPAPRLHGSCAGDARESQQ